MKTLDVRLSGQPREILLGRLAQTREGIYFEYSREALAARLELSPLKLPLAAGARLGPASPFGGLHGLFNDSLPDGFGALLLDRWIAKQGVDPRAATPLDRLAIIGSRGMGALSYRPEQAPHQETVQWNLEEAEKQIQRVAHGETSTILPELLQAGGSPQGARAKLLVSLSADMKTAVSGPGEVPRGFTASIVKFATDPRSDSECRLEEAYARMARAAGIRMPDTGFVDVGKGRVAFAAARFDRRGNVRTHVQSASALLEIDHRVPSLDYDSLLRLARVLSRSQVQVEAMYRLAVFNLLAHNRDDHAKNFAFMQDAHGEWTVAPGYDLTFSQGPGGEHTTTVMGEGRTISVAQLEALGRQASISPAVIAETVDRVREAISSFPSVARELGVPARAARQVTSVILPSGAGGKQGKGR
jgi:serine/threonine-protein kinase HipA